MNSPVSNEVLKQVQNFRQNFRVMYRRNTKYYPSNIVPKEYEFQSKSHEKIQKSKGSPKIFPKIHSAIGYNKKKNDKIIQEKNFNEFTDSENSFKFFNFSYQKASNSSGRKNPSVKGHGKKISLHLPIANNKI